MSAGRHDTAGRLAFVSERLQTVRGHAARITNRHLYGAVEALADAVGEIKAELQEQAAFSELRKLGYSERLATLHKMVADARAVITQDRVNFLADQLEVEAPVIAGGAP